MKQKSIVWRVLAILLLAFLWGGNQCAYAYVRAWCKLDRSAKTLTFYYSNKTDWGSDEFPVATSVPYSKKEYLAYADYIEKAVFDKSFADYRPEDCKYWFSRLSKLKTIEGIEYLNTSEATSMTEMFNGCSSLTELDLTNFDSSKLEHMSGMFNGCSSLKTIWVSDKFAMDKVVDRTYQYTEIFYNCTSLVGDVPFDPNYTNGTYAKLQGGYFSNIVRLWATYADGTLTFRYGPKKAFAANEYKLNWIDESTPDWLLSHKSSIKRVVFDPSFAAARPTHCCNWFLDCSNLETVEGLEYFNSSEVQTMFCMFSGCSSGLKSLDLTKLDVQNVTNMLHMFYGCRALTELDLTGFNTAKVKNAIGMFRDCSSLTKIYADQMFTLPDGAVSDKMFAGCTSLKGDIAYDPNTTDKTYATVDGGYFSEKGNDRMWAKYADGTLTFSYGPKRRLGTDEYFVTYSLPGWHDKAGEIKKVVFDESCKEAQPTTCYAWFKDAGQLTAIEGLEYLNTRYVTDMSWMFFGCSSLATLDLTKLPLTQKVTNMGWMFYGCSSLTSLNLAKLRQSFKNVTHFERMFLGCSSLTELNFKNFATTKAEDMTAMFYGCSSLTSLDLTSFTTENVWSLTNMFNGCTSLKTLDISRFDTYNCRYFNKMFYGCSNLVTIYATENFRFDKDLRPETQQMFEGCSSLQGSTIFNRFVTDKTYAKVDEGYFTDRQYTRPWVKYDNGTLTFTYSYKKTLDASAGEYALDDEGASDGGWRALLPEVKNAVFYRSTFKFYAPTSCNTWFRGASQLTSIDGLYNVNTSNITDMSGMFEGCSSLTYVGLITNDLSNVTDMSGMFRGCSALTGVRLNENTQNVKNMAGMFKDCSSVARLYLYDLNTASVTDMREMFAGCTTLRTILASDKFVTTNVENSTDMFAGCTRLKGAIAFDASAVDKTYAKVDGGYFTKPADFNAWVAYSKADKTLTFQCGNKTALEEDEYWLNDKTTEPGWNEHRNSTQKVVFDPSFAAASPTSCYQWFCDNSSMQTIVGLEYLNTTEVSTMEKMFQGCHSLQSVDLSRFNTKYVKSMYNMFYYCTSLTNLDVSNFETSAVTSMGNMFSNCSKLQNLYLGDSFTVKEGDGEWIFNNLPSAVVHVTPGNYASLKAREDFAGVNLRPYFSINAKAPFGTLCVPFGGTLAEGSFSGFDKLYRVKDADADKGTVTLEETTTIEPGVAYVYRRSLPEDAAKSAIAFTVDDNVPSATEPQNDGNLMKGTFKSTYAPMGSYILLTDGNFHPVAADKSNPVGAYRAYLDLSQTVSGEPSAAQTYRMVLVDGEVTGIGGITNNGITDLTDQQPKAVYDLTGRRINAPQKGGIYIVDGKKIMYNK